MGLPDTVKRKLWNGNNMISFIIPTKNEEKELAETLKWILSYSGEKEIIVSDGRSRDRTVEIAREMGARVVEYTGKAKQTISAGRNGGAAVAKGEFYVFLDADVRIKDPDAFFRTAQDFFRKNPRLVALTVWLQVLPGLETFFDRIIFTCANIVHIIFNNICSIAAAPGEFQMVRAEAFKKTGGYNEKLAAGEDYDFFKRMGKLGDTRFNLHLKVYHTGRRAHVVGWPKLLFTWGMNAFSVWFLNKAVSEEWTEVR